MTHSNFQLDRGPDHKRLITWLSLVLVTLSYLSGIGHAQQAVVLAPLPQLQFFDQSGRPLAFGCVFTYEVQSTTPLQTYTDFSGTTLNQNPVILSAGGSANIWLAAGQAYTFRVKSAGGTNCASGSTLYTVDGIGGGSTVLTTNVTFSSTPTFIDAAQIQLFLLTLTGNATAQPMSFVGITPPGIIYFQITQDGSGGHSFSWPANTVGGCTIASGANVTTTQEFVYNGTDATAVGPCVTGTGPAVVVGSLEDSGLTASLVVCTDANMVLTSTCTGLIPNSDLVHASITFNGQTVALGGSGNVNNGAATHSVAINEGAGAAIAGVGLTADQALVGVSGADPAGKTLCNGQLSYNTSTHAFVCQPANANGASLLIQQTLLTGCSGTCTYSFPTSYSVAPGCVCTGVGGSCNVASVSQTQCVLNTTTSTAYVLAVGAP